MKRSPSLKIKFENIDRMNGFEFEEFVSEILIAKGYRDVTVTKKTGDFGVDATCFPVSPKDKRRIAIQIKRYNSPVSVGAVQEVVAGAAMYKAELKIVITNSTFTTNAKLLAENNDCVLVDRLTLQNWVYEVEKKVEKAKKPKRFKLKRKDALIAPIIAEPVEVKEESHQELDNLHLEFEVDNILLAEQTKHLSPESITSIQFPVTKPLSFDNAKKKQDEVLAPPQESDQDVKEKETVKANGVVKDEAQEDISFSQPVSNESEKIEDTDKDCPMSAEIEETKVKTETVVPTIETTDVEVTTDIEVDLPISEDEEFPVLSEPVEVEVIEDELEVVSVENIDDFDVPDL